MRMRPEVTSKKAAESNWTSVDLPAPLGPTRREHFTGVHLEIDVMKNLVLAFFTGIGESHVLKLMDLAKVREG